MKIPLLCLFAVVLWSAMRSSGGEVLPPPVAEPVAAAAPPSAPAEQRAGAARVAVVAASDAVAAIAAAPALLAVHFDLQGGGGRALACWLEIDGRDSMAVDAAPAASGAELACSLPAPMRLRAIRIRDAATGVRWHLPLDLELAPGQTERRRVALPSTPELCVAVRDRDGAAIAAGTVLAREAGVFLGLEFERETLAFRGGCARVPRVAPRVHVEAAVPGYVAFRSLLWDSEAERPPAAEMPALLVAPAEPWQVQVVDASGVPVVGAVLRILPRFGAGAGDCNGTALVGGSPDGFAVRTADDGRVRLQLGIALDYALAVAHPDFAPYECELPGGRRPERLVLVRGATVAALVVDGTGMPLAGVEVRPLDGRRAAVYTRVDGRVEVAGVDPENGMPLLLTRSGFVARMFRLGVVAPGDPVRIELAAGLTFAGTVFDLASRPARGAIVRLQSVADSGRPAVDVECDVDGRFRAEGLVPGRHALSIAPRGDARAEFVDFVEAGWSDYMAVVGRRDGAELRINVRAGDGGPAPERFALALLWDAEAGVRTGERFDVVGATHWQRGGLRTGPMLLRVSAPGWAEAELPLQLDGGVREVEVVLRRG